MSTFYEENQHKGIATLAEFPGYYFLPDGSIYSDRLKRYIKQNVSGKTEYKRVWLYSSENVKKSFYAHVLIALAFHGPRPTSEHMVDHRDRNSLNNNVDNLRYITRTENFVNSDYAENGSSKYLGVNKRGINKAGVQRWEAAIMINGERNWLGLFTDELEAAKAYDKMARKYNRYTNFPDGISREIQNIH